MRDEKRLKNAIDEMTSLLEHAKSYLQKEEWDDLESNLKDVETYLEIALDEV